MGLLRKLCPTTLLLILAGALVLGFMVAPVSASAGEKPKSARSKVIDFDDEIVEGLNKRPLDSLSQISEGGKRKKKPHLYRKRAGFRTETAETVRELRYVQ